MLIQAENIYVGRMLLHSVLLLLLFMLISSDIWNISAVHWQMAISKKISSRAQAIAYQFIVKHKN